MLCDVIDIVLPIASNHLDLGNLCDNCIDSLDLCNSCLEPLDLCDDSSCLDSFDLCDNNCLYSSNLCDNECSNEIDLWNDDSSQDYVCEYFNLDNNWENIERVPRDEVWEFPNIDRFNDEIDQKRRNVEEDLLKKYESESWLRLMLIRYMLWLKWYLIFLMGMRISPVHINGWSYFNHTPSFYAVREYIKNFYTINGINWYYPSGMLLLFYAYRITLLNKIPSGSVQAYYRAQTLIYKNVLRTMGIGNRAILIAEKIGKKLARKIWR